MSETIQINSSAIFDRKYRENDLRRLFVPWWAWKVSVWVWVKTSATDRSTKRVDSRENVPNGAWNMKSEIDYNHSASQSWMLTTSGTFIFFFCINAKEFKKFRTWDPRGLRVGVGWVWDWWSLWWEFRLLGLLDATQARPTECWFVIAFSAVEMMSLDSRKKRDIPSARLTLISLNYLEIGLQTLQGGFPKKNVLGRISLSDCLSLVLACQITTSKALGID